MSDIRTGSKIEHMMNSNFCNAECMHNLMNYQGGPGYAEQYDSILHKDMSIF